VLKNDAVKTGCKEDWKKACMPEANQNGSQVVEKVKPKISQKAKIVTK
jgi:hypothetical protein